MKETGGYYEQYPERKEISRNRLIWLIDELCNSSQAEFARKTGLQRSTVSMYLSGKNVLGIRNASKIGHIFDVNRDWLRGDPNAPMSRYNDRSMISPMPSDHNLKQKPDQKDAGENDLPIREILDAHDYYQLADILYAYLHADPATQWAIQNLLGIKSEHKEDSNDL